MQTAAIVMACMFAVAATLSAYAAIVNAEWFFRSPNVRILTGALPRWAQRAIYAILAIAMGGLAIHLFISSFSLTGR